MKKHPVPEWEVLGFFRFVMEMGNLPENEVYYNLNRLKINTF